MQFVTAIESVSKRSPVDTMVLTKQYHGGDLVASTAQI